MLVVSVETKMLPLFSPGGLNGAVNDLRLPRCGQCGLFSRCRSPKMPATGEGRLGVLIVAEAPGREEDLQGVQLVGPAGQLLRRYLREIGIDLDRDCWKTNAVTCFPGRNPTSKEVSACRPNLLKVVRELRPKTVLLLGAAAISSLIGWLWREEEVTVARWAGWRIPSQQLNAWVCPTYHPSFLLRSGAASESKRSADQSRVVSILFREHLRKAFELSERPWRNVPDYRKSVRVIVDAAEAAKAVGRFSGSPRPVAFDLETNMLKPDCPQADVVSCALSDGENTVAFPLLAEAREAFAEFLRSPVPKVAHNMKFEDRWCRRVLRTSVKRWYWCTMQTAHVLDNRRGICGLKFQAFVRLGQPPYDEQVSGFLGEEDSNGLNRIRMADVRDLLLYNGLDALLTWHLYEKQREDLAGGKLAAS